MQLIDFVRQCRDHYVEQFCEFAERQQKQCLKGAAEVKLQVGEASKLYRFLGSADFVVNDLPLNGPQVVDFRPEYFPDFDPISSPLGDGTLVIEHLRWDDVLIYHNVANLPMDQIDHWFQRWMDPDDAFYKEGNLISNNIHSLIIEPTVLCVDFGTAPAEALMEIMDLLDRGGVTMLRISSSQAEAG